MSLQRFTFILASVFLLNSFALAQSADSGISIEQKSEAPNYGILDELNIGQTPLLKSERKGAIDRDATKITIKTNVPNSEIFINGNFEGYSTLTITNLPEGKYNLRVEKKGYRPKRYRIKVINGEERVFYIELEQYEGTVCFITEPQDAEIYVDYSPLSDNIVKLSEGRHTVQARKFGYTTETAGIYIPRDTYQIVTAKLSPAEFALKELRSNKESFNPYLPGTLGTIKFHFEVTAKETGTFTITDSSNNVVATYTLPEFSTWEQEVKWDGKTFNKNIIPDGTYRATVEAGGQKLSTTFRADSSIKVASASFTASGSGIGILPAAFANPKTTMAVGVNAGTVLTKSDFYCAPLSAFFAYSFLDCMELTLKAGLNAGHKGSSPFINSALKFAFCQKMNGFDFDYGLLARAGGASNEPFEPYGADSGCGVGGGFVMGIDTSKVYAGFSSEFTYGTSTFNTQDNNYDKVWRNGLSLQLKTQTAALGLYSALNSSFGTTGLEGDDRSSSSAQWTRAVDFGFDARIPAKDNIFVNIRGNARIFSSKTYYSAEAGISTLL